VKTKREEENTMINDFALCKARKLREAATAARAHAEECKRVAEEAAEKADEADDIALDLESDADDWESVANGDLTLEEILPSEDCHFSFDD
jgi:hypothetical protein